MTSRLQSQGERNNPTGFNNVNRLYSWPAGICFGISFVICFTTTHYWTCRQQVKSSNWRRVRWFVCVALGKVERNNKQEPNLLCRRSGLMVRITERDLTENLAIWGSSHALNITCIPLSFSYSISSKTDISLVAFTFETHSTFYIKSSYQMCVWIEM